MNVSDIRAHTLCKVGLHCRPSKRIQKFDGGRRPALCCHCMKIIGHWPRHGIGAPTIPRDGGR
jgi:hypothetical protein